jgi:SAM-dependent methyltransferase
MTHSVGQDLLDIMQCTQCAGRITISSNLLICAHCGCDRSIDSHGIVRDPSLETLHDDSLYEWATKTRYQSLEYASKYMAAYACPRTLNDFYAGFVTWREQTTVYNMLKPIARHVRLVLDLPAGIGKLAPVHANFPYRVIAADASAEMLAIGAEVWRNAHQLAGMMQTDVRHTGLQSGSIDCTVCLRLMHRLPADVASEALNELARVTKRFLIISTRIRTRTISSIRKAPRTHGVAPLDLDEWHRRLAVVGELQSTSFVARGVSQEVVSRVEIFRPPIHSECRAPAELAAFAGSQT